MKALGIDLLFTMSDSLPTKACASVAKLFHADEEVDRQSINRQNCQTSKKGLGGARRDRTDDILLAKQALSQLSYGPVKTGFTRERNLRPGNQTRQPGLRS